MKLKYRWPLAATLAIVLAACGGSDPGAPSAAAPQQRLLSTSLAAFNGHGTWWNPAEPGSGFVFEAQGATGVITYFTYEAGGKPVWYSGAGAFTLRDDGKYAFSATLFRYAGGQPASSSTPRTPSRTEVGATTVVFDGNSAQVTIPGRTYAATKFNPATASGGVQPEAGIYWNPDQSGRGFTMEVANNIVSIGVFHYDADGQPTWNLVVGDMATGKLSAPFTSYSGGQPFGGSHKVPTPSATTQQFQANFANACRGDIQFPGMAPVAVTRFPFGGLPQGAECRSSTLAAGDGCSSVVQGFRRGPIETVAADAGYAGGDGGTSGDGGGAAAGGGLGKVLAGLLRVTDLSDGSVLGEAVTDGRDGLVTVKTCKRAGPFLLTLEGREGAQYFDEGLNQLTDFGPGQLLHALVDRWDEHVGVSPLTEAAYRYALNNFKANAADVAAGRAPLAASGSLVGLTTAQAKAANDMVANAANRRLPANYQIASAKTLPTPIDAGSAATALQDNRYGRSAAVNGGLVKAASQHNPSLPAPALKLANDLARDFTDGRVDGFALDGSQVSPADTITYESVRLPLAATIATNAVTARFGTPLFPGQLRIEEEAFVGFVPAPNTPLSQVPGAVDCAAFQDEIALLSDGSVTVVRRFPSTVGANCKFTFDGAENARVVKLRNFLTNVKALGRGTQVAYAIRNDGTVVGWGENYCGSLAPNLPNRIYAQPEVIPGLRDITAISQSSSGAIARDRTGSVFYWGSNGNPQLGTQCDTAKWQHAGIQKTTLANAVETHAAGNNFFALTADGTVYGWGEGFAGLLANADSATDFLRGPAIQNPTPIPGLGKVRQLAFLELTAFALTVDGTVLAWGEDDQRLLGGGTQRRTPRPTAVPGLTGVATMVGATGGMRFQKTDGTMLAWGDGLIGTFPKTYFATPTVVNPPQRVRHIISRNAGYSVFYESGVVGRDLANAIDESPKFR